jgi:glucose/arabinose dehydrogenase
MKVMAVVAIFMILYALCPRADSAAVGLRSSSSLNQDQAFDPHSIELERVLEGLDQPTFVTGARDGSGRLFIVERPGRIKVLAPGADSPALFLDIAEKVSTREEGGLLGLAFHPLYRENRRFFVCYSSAIDEATVVAEYAASPSDPDAAGGDERVLVVIPQPSDLHHGGMIEFGLDNFLYVSTGDGDWEDPDHSAQNVESLRGKILRLDVDHAGDEQPYSSPPTNPFFGSVPGRDEVYALGFRNPWRFAFDSVTGQLYVADVGHEEREEVNVVTLGGNYGWRAFEGTRCTGLAAGECDPQQFFSPVVEYDHGNGRCSVTGGRVYRGAESVLPFGSYLFADFCTGEIMLLNEGRQQLLLDTDLLIVSFGEDDVGEIYVVGLGGTVYRIVASATASSDFRIDSVGVRLRSTAEPLQPVVVKRNAKKYEVVVRGAGFAAGAAVFVDGREMKTSAGAAAGVELVARLRRGTLGRPGALLIEVVNADGARSNGFEVEVVADAGQD